MDLVAREETARAVAEAGRSVKASLCDDGDHGAALQVETRVESAWLQRFKLYHDQLLSGFALKCNLCTI
jgi:hypothetical protein